MKWLQCQIYEHEDEINVIKKPLYYVHTSTFGCKAKLVFALLKTGHRECRAAGVALFINHLARWTIDTEGQFNGLFWIVFVEGIESACHFLIHFIDLLEDAFCLEDHVEF